MTGAIDIRVPAPASELIEDAIGELVELRAKHTRILATLAQYVDEYSVDSGGGHMRTMLRAALLADRHGLAPDKAIDLARNDAWDGRVRDAGRELDRLLGEARRVAEAREDGESAADEVRS
jgi:hypothetical protein